MNPFTPYLYTKGQSPALDAQFAGARKFGKVRLGTDAIFWRSGLKLYTIPFNRVRRIFRRISSVAAKICCGRQNFDIEWIVLILADGTEVEIHIGDDAKREAEGLLDALKQTHPELEYGKV